MVDAVSGMNAHATMNICFVGMDNLPVLAPEYGHLPIGGESVQQTLIARALARRGCRISMVVADWGQDDGAQWDGIRIYKSFRPGSGLPGLRFIHPRWTGMWRALKRADAEVYYTSCAGMHVGLLALFCRRFGRRLVFRAASDPDCDRSRLSLLVKYARDRWLYRYGLHRADAILVQSSVQARALANSYRLASRIAGMLVDAPVAAARRDIDVLWVGNIKRVKRPDRIFDVAAKLQQVRIHVAGGETRGEEAFYRTFTRAAADASNVVFHGRLPYGEASALYGRARVLLNTSDVEGFPNAYLQAWQNGVPVVTLIDPDHLIAREGLGVVASSPAVLNVATGSLLNDPTAWKAASERCKAYMAREYSEDRILQDYIDVFQHATRHARVNQSKLSPSRHHV
jgi:glycosyltransferase involved in cell wall biosynthesis